MKKLFLVLLLTFCLSAPVLALEPEQIDLEGGKGTISLSLQD